MVRYYRIRLLLLRGAMLAAFTLFTAWMLTASASEVRQLPIAGIIVLWLIVSLPLLTDSQALPEWTRSMQAQLLSDIILLSFMLYYSGGYANPLLSFYLFPILIAGMTLPRQQAWLAGILVVISYTLLIRFYIPLPLMQGMPPGFHMHLLGMWLTFVAMVIILLGVVIHMSDERRQREARLADLRQQAIRHRHMLALGAQAAADAHEMGTPVNSMLLLLEQYREEQGNNELTEHMHSQLERCRHILQRLSQRARAICETGQSDLSPDELAADVVRQWRNLHPDVQLTTEFLPPLPYPPISDHAPLEEALWIVLDNACEAAATQITLRLQGQHQHLLLEIRDNGHGIDPAILNRLGHQPLSHQRSGKGLGLYLLRYMLENSGGQCMISNHQHGACIRCLLPWATTV